MSRDKVDAVVRNWFPRFLANGLDYLDVARTLEGIGDWDDWAPAWTASADGYARLGESARVAGHRVTAAEHLRRAALTLQFAQFVLTEDRAARSALQRRQAALYAAAAPLLDPPATRMEIPHDGGTVLGYLRLPEGTAAGLVVLIPGLESTKEQFSTFEPFFLRRGVATLSVEGPGQGEAGLEAPFTSETYGRAIAAVAAWVERRSDVDARRVAVVGTSFGGYLALRYAAAFASLVGVVDIAGPYDLADFDALQPVTQDSFREFVGADDLDETRRRLAHVTLDGVLDGLDVPVLVVHGERDTIIPVAHARRIVGALGARAEARLEPAGNHSCNNIHTIVRPAVADWVADRLEE